MNGFQKALVLAPMLLTCAGDVYGTALADNETISKEQGSAQRLAQAAFSPDETAQLALKEFRSSYTKCAETSSGITWEILDCISIELRYQDVRLNKSYKRLVRQLSEDEGSKLRGSQRNWISQRDAECMFDPKTGGHGQLIESESCKLNMTAVKAKELEDIAAIINENASKELKSFIPPGARELAIATGDINSDGRQDAVLIIDYPGTGNERLGEGLPRSLLLLVRNDSGTLQRVAQNNKLVPCADCGGIWGDPFSSISAGNGSFMLVIEGGSRWHWLDEYTFRYNKRKKDWFPKKARRVVVDRLTTEGKTIEMSDSKAPSVSISDFDPAKIPSVEM